MPDGDCLLPSAPTPSISVPEGSIKDCSISAGIIAATDPGSLAEVIEKLTGGQEEIETLCRTTLVNAASSPCPSDGPWFVVEDYQVSMIVPLARKGCFGLLRELAFWQDGTEESSLVNEQRIWSSDPVDAWIEMSNAERDCIEDSDEELCGLVEIDREQIVITGLADGNFLVTEVGIDSDVMRKRQERAGGPIEVRLRGIEDPSVEITGTTAVIEACGGSTKVELPASVTAAGAELDGEQTNGEAPASPASPEQAKAASERCNEGWVKFGKGDLAGATLDIDMALGVLERATDERSRRSLGACLYNRGRIAEEAGNKVLAIELYRRSLVARPNDTVQARLDSLVAP